ncbi:MAG: DEAD/DEAH box helicase [Vicinamibacterales bacterium]
MDAPGSVQSQSTGWQPGDRLTLRGENWTVVGCAEHPDCEELRVDADRDRRRHTFLLPFDRPRRIRHDGVTIVSRRAWWHRLTQLLADAYPYGGLRFYPDSIDLLPYQLEPGIAMLREGHPRLLIADDVGLGKTIEAGLILRELALRNDGFRAMLLVPAGLRQQWSEELTTRFSLEPIVADAPWLREVARALPPDVNPWSLPGTYLSSFDFVKRAEALRPLEDVRWDLLVVDEAHAATLSTDRRAAVDAVAARAQRVLLLTATPPGDPAQLAGLCRIGSFPGDADIPIFERGRASQAVKPRRSSVVLVRLNEAERRMHRSLERYTTLMWAEAARTGNPHARLVSTILRKRALSSAAALELSLRRRKDLLTGQVIVRQRQLLLPLQDDEDAEDDMVPDTSLGSWILEDRATEEYWLEESIRGACDTAETESKVRALKKLLTRVREPMIVFTEYRDTLACLQRFLQAGGLHTCAIHGGLTTAERRAALTEFARGHATLLATDAAAEGLNLQQRCRTVVHYELPWNPARMLQRTGRVDRIGQTRRVHEIALVAADTAETLVVAPLARRATAWSDSRGHAWLEWLTESRIAEAVFDGEPPRPDKTPTPRGACIPIDLHADAVIEARRLEGRRVLLGSRRSIRPTASRDIPCTAIYRSSLASGIVLIFELKVLHWRETVERTVVALHCRIDLRPWSRKVSHIRGCVSALLPQVLEIAVPAVARLVRKRAEAIHVQAHEAWARTHARARSLQQLHGSAARQLVQIGLFERRQPRAGDWVHRTSAPLGPDRLERQTDPDEPAISSSANLRALLLIPPR